MTDRIGPIRPSATPPTDFYLEADVTSQDPATNTSNLHVALRAVNRGNTTSNFLGEGIQRGYLGGYLFGYHTANPFLPSGFGSGAQRWKDEWDITLYHDANGYYNGGAPMSLSMQLQYGSVDAWYGGSISVPRIARVPAAPNQPSASAVGPTSMTLSWNIPDNRGAAVDQMLLRRFTTPDLSGPFSQYVLPGNATSHTPTDLTPGTTYYWVVYARNSVGYSDRSGILTQGTLPSSAPGMTLTPSLNGTQVTVALTPPGSASGVTQYRTERRLLGTTAPVTSVNSPTSPLAHTGLTPGAQYEFRAQAIFGAYESPWTAWTLATLPNPNTDPGAFFDGATAATAALTYAFTGTVNKSPSTASGRHPTGWRTFAQAAATSGGVGACFQASGGVEGLWAARYVFFTDATAAGFLPGMNSATVAHMAQVEALSEYVGSVHAWLSRSQRVRGVTMFYTEAGAYVGQVVGDAIEAAPGAFIRFSAGGIVPATATRAITVIQDVAGAGWSLWRSGDWIHMDASMVSLGLTPVDWFSGDSPPTPGFDYLWLGDPNASVSQRIIVPIFYEDPLADPDCSPLPTPPMPPSIPADCIDEQGTWRQYALQIPAEEVSLWAATLPTLTLSTSAVAERQVRIRYFENPDGLPPASVDMTTWDAEMILTYIPPYTEITLDAVTQRVWASVGGAAEIAGDQLLYGTGGVPATWPELRCGVGYVVTLDVPLEAPAGNLETSVTLTQRM